MQDRSLIMKIGWGVLIVCVLTCVGLGVWLFGNGKKPEEKQPETTQAAPKKNYKHLSALYEVINKQKNLDLDKELGNDCTFEKACTKLNPYGLSPLSGIIKFDTEEEQEVKVFINDIYFTTMEKTKNHVIPIYGLYEDKNNIVRLVMGDKEAKYNFKTEKSNIKYNLNVTKNLTKNTANNLIFMEGSFYTGLTGWDYQGNLRFYLTEMFKMDVEWLENGHFIVGVDIGNDLDGYKANDRDVGFVEMDYLGKIYNYYIVQNGFDFESQILSNGNYLIGGGNTAIYFTNQLVYELDPKTNKVVSSLDVTKAIRDVDPEFDTLKSGQGMGKNGFYYDETTKEIVISMRQSNALISLNYETGKINWIITTKNNKFFSNPVWKDYIIEADFEPLGQHSPQILGNGLYAFYDNKYDRVDSPTEVLTQKDNSSEAIIFKIENRVAKTVWNSNKLKFKYFTQKFGYFRVDENNNKYIDFGWVLHDEIYKEGNVFQNYEGDVKATYGVYVEINADNKIVFEGICEEGKYRIFKHDLYLPTTRNINLKELTIYNNMPLDDYETIEVNKSDMDNALEYINYFEFTENTFYTDLDFTNVKKLDLVFVNYDDEKKAYNFNYFDKDKSSVTNKTFNIKLPTGVYKFFIVVDGKYYYTNNTYSFEEYERITQ